ncbi:MAG: hypothetical protein Q9N32_06755, partial [Gammaproteobacteria bacterium]|nr:hypothetical protein [Gammaproteobacteria bacterium]
TYTVQQKMSLNGCGPDLSAPELSFSTTMVFKVVTVLLPLLTRCANGLGCLVIHNLNGHAVIIKI